MTSVKGRGQPTCRGQEAPTSPPSFKRFDNGDHEDPLRSNKPGPFETPVEPSEILARPEAPAGPPQAPLVAPDIARYT